MGNFAIYVLRIVMCRRFWLCLLAVCASSAVAQEWKPEHNVEMIVSSGAGGAADRSARTIQRFLKDVPGIPSVSVVNKAGGGGTVAWTSLNQHNGDAHYISTLNVALVTNQIVGRGKLRYQDVTPLNIMMYEYVAVWTRADSDIKSGKDLVERLKKDPSSVSFGISPALGNQNHIVLSMIARAAGIDPKTLKIVVYSSGGDGTTAALGGHIDAWAGTAGSARQYIESGKIRVLGLSADQRQGGAFAQVPTFLEQGIDAKYYAFRGFLAPGGLSAAQIAFWDKAFSSIVVSDAWSAELAKNSWGRVFKGSAETREYLETEHKLLEKILTDLGLVKR